VKLSGEYMQLIEQLKNSFSSSTDTALSLVEQAKRDGLSKEQLNEFIIKQMSGEDIRETCSLAKMLYYMLNDFLHQTAADVEHDESMGMGMAEFIKKCIDACARFGNKNNFL
jgi:hypothetical protein